jgi:predicted negative regulator of RcsB-dependent stress response
MNKRTGWLLTAAVLGLGAITASGQDCYVVRRDGNKVPAVAITVASADGDLLLQTDKAGKVKMPVKRAQYKYAMIPKPREVAALEQAFDNGKFDDVLANSAAIFEKYKFLGWGDRIAFLEGMVRIERKQFAQAKDILEKGMRVVALQETELIKAMVLALVGLNQTAEAKAMVDRMMKSAEDNMAAFAFNARGRLYAAEGKKKEAVLDYLKTLLLFQAGTADGERQEAKRQVVALLKEMGDARWQEIEKMDLGGGR